MASAMTPASEDQISIGLCSTQPGRGKYCVNSICAVERILPSWSKTMAREEDVPWSSARMNFSAIYYVVISHISVADVQSFTTTST